MLARKLQSGLHQFAKPWYRFRAMRVFRDETSLSNTPELWPSIEAALSQSEYFLLLASPEATASDEVGSGLGKRIFTDGIRFSPLGQILATVHSDGSIVLWDLNVVARACRLVGRNLSQKEWERYKPNRPYRKTCDGYLRSGSLKDRFFE